MVESPSEPGAGARSNSKGCLIALLVGVGTALVVGFLCVGGSTYLSKQLMTWVSDQSHRIEEDARDIAAWNAPPKDADPALFAPETVAKYTLVEQDQDSTFPALGIEEPGFHAVYERSSERLDVCVYQMDIGEKSNLFAEVERRVSNDVRFPGHQIAARPNVLDFTILEPPLAGRLWYGKGWLIFVRGESSRDIADFTSAYRDAVAKQSGAESDENAESTAPPTDTSESSDSESSSAVVD